MPFQKIDEKSVSGEKEDKVVMIYGFSEKQLSEFIDHYKNNKELPKTNFVAVNDKTKLKRVRDVIIDAVKESRILGK